MSDLRAPSHHLSPLLNCLKVALDTLQVACKEVLQSKKNLVVRVDASNEQLGDKVTDLIAKINGYAANNIAAVRAICHDRAKVLDTQADKLIVSAGQMTACVKVGRAAMASQQPVGLTRALQTAAGVQELCKMAMKPSVSAMLDIVAVVNGVLEGLETMTVLRLYDVDGNRSVVSGPGLVSCVRGSGGVNKVNVTCVNGAGKPTDWVTNEDVDVFVASVHGALIGQTAGGQVIGKGEIVIHYKVDDLDVNEVQLSVTVGGVKVRGGPWQVAVCDAIQTDAAHVKTHRINNINNYGVAATFDGQYLVVSNIARHNIAVYSTDDGSCITTFGSHGAGAGQFSFPYRVCATPRGTILVSEHGNQRLQEVTLTGEHVRFIGEGRFDDERVFGLCMQGDIIAVGISGVSIGGRILVFSFSSGDLLRQFGPNGSGEGQVKNVSGLSFTPDGKHILVAYGAPRLSIFTVDGAFVKTIGVGVISAGTGDVLCSGSSVFLVDAVGHCIYVFASETGTLIRKWGIQGQADGQFMFPMALAAYKSKLFVLDAASPRVQVFE